VIAGSQQTQNVATEKVERTQTVPTEPVQNVSTKWKQNAATHYRDNNIKNKAIEKTDRENQETWQKALEQLKGDLPLEQAPDRLIGTVLLEVTDTAALIGVPNRFAVPWLERRLYGQIAKAMKAVVGKDLDLQFIAAS
jgi:hypothetical protein